MRLALLTAAIAVALFSAASGANGQTSIEPGLFGADLMEKLRENYRPTTPKSYNAARQAMFSDIDNVNGKVRCVYTGVEFATNGTPANDDVMNTEHTWPQGKFDERSPMRSDLHHLFPTLTPVNGERSNNPFREIPDFDTKEFYDKATKVTTPPPIGQRDRYSESDNHSFEPREDHEGNVARAMLYFWVVYAEDGIQPSFIDGQLSTFALWHKLDPVDQKERDRNAKIKALQGNDNPFILDETLVDRVLGTTPARVAGPAAALARARAPRPAPSDAAAPMTVQIGCWNMQSDLDSDESDEDHLAGQLAEKQDIRLWGLSEVLNEEALEKFVDGAQEGEPGRFVGVLGTTAKGDYLAVVYDSTIFEQVGSPIELVEETRLSRGLRASLGLHLRGVATGQEFLFLVNHLKRGGTNDRAKLKQSRNLNRWVRQQTLPVILAGDFNYDYRLDGRGRSRGFDLLTDDGVCRWVRPRNDVQTQADTRNQHAPSMLDFFFVANEPFGWTGFVDVLDRDGNRPAAEVDFEDDARESDHRPLRATLIFQPPSDN